MTKVPLEFRARDMVVNEISSDTVVAAWNYDVLVTTTGRAFAVANIQVTTIRDGLIVRSCDYRNHALLAKALGR
jgi:ketosteroid isomerase-like protein